MIRPVILALAVSAVSSLSPAWADAPYDVVVYGSTPSGLVAAIAAARQKASVIVVSPSEHLGGMVAGGLSSTDTGDIRAIGGICLEFFERCRTKYSVKTAWKFEPHVYTAVFEEMAKESGIKIVHSKIVKLVKKKNERIESFETADGQVHSGKVFIDATYEGDLMAMARVGYIVGRESRAQYGESLAGYYPMEIRRRTPEIMAAECECFGGNGPHYIHGTPTKISARDASGRLLFGVEEAPKGMKPGDADHRTQSYNFRLAVTRKVDNRIPFSKPNDYDPNKYELLLRLIKSYPTVRFTRLFHLSPLPNDKYDLNAAGLFSTDYAGANTAYPDGDVPTRDRIWQDHISYTQGLFWFLCHDERLPQSLRDEANQWGLCKDEFADNNYWPYQLYVREARRMIGAYVMQQKDVQKEIVKDDTIAMGSFLVDCHIVQRIANADGDVIDEGSFPDMPVNPYQIPYRSLIPLREQCNNLFVPVCLSASHIAYCTLRMEPVYMALGHASGVAAAMAAREGSAVQDVDVRSLQAILRKQRQVLDLPEATQILRPEKLAGIVVDDRQAQFTGQWQDSTYGLCVNGFSKNDMNIDKGEKKARFDLAIPKEGDYEVRLAYSPAQNRATNVPVTIAHAKGSKTIHVNQRLEPAKDRPFISLGTFRFEPNRPASVEIETTNTDGFVVADAVQLLPIVQ